jgi:TonB family protein
VQLPVLKTFVQAEYPEQARAQGLQAAVELELTISSAGQVTDAKVVAAAGNGFDEAAVQAALQFVFEPAKKDGVPIAARIRYRYLFELAPPAEAPPSEPPAAAPASPPSSISSAPAKGDASTQSTAQLASQPASTSPAADTTTETEESSASYGASARVDPPRRETSRTILRTEEITRIPGTRGDALRAIELLPGVGRPPFTLGLVLIRGAAPQDSEVFFEGVPIPLIYHFGGLTSVINSRLIDNIKFYPGNFSVRYGRKMGGVIEVEGNDPQLDAVHGVADINLIDGSLLLQAPIGKKGSISVSARRSIIDTWLGPVLNSSDSFSTVAAPVYYDYQLFGTYRLTSRDRLRLTVYGSSDRLKLFINQPSDTDPELRGNLDAETGFARVGLQWQRQLTDQVRQSLEFAVGTTDLRFAAGPQQQFSGAFVPMQGRAEWQGQASKEIRLVGGMDIQITPAKVRYIGPPPRQQEGDPGAGGFNGEPSATQNTLFEDLDVTVYRPAAYLESNFLLTPVTNLITGLRTDYYKEIRRWSIDPRASIRHGITPSTTLKGGLGLFSQPPEFQESAPGFGNPNLKPMHAVHTSAGVEHRVTEAIEVGAEAFYKRLYDRVVNTPQGQAPFFVNDGTGNIYGLELSGRAQPRGRWFGFLSYTLMRSERRDGDGPTRLFDFDQTHILTASSMFRLGKGWEAGATFRLVTGNPYTPIVGNVYNANTDLYQPLYGAVNSRRNPTFNRLDVRVEKQWVFDSWRLATYLDVQNIYNAENPEGVSYSYDYLQTSTIRGLPIIPSLGVRGEF